jgi:hypothetical protein
VPITRIIKRLFVLLTPLLLLLFWCPPAKAQIHAAGCDSTSVQNAFNVVTASTTTVTIPSCPSGVAWTKTVTLTVPSGNKNLTIIGAGSQMTTGGGNQTVIIDNVNHSSGDSATLQIVTGAASSVVRLSGITIEQNGSSSQTFNGMLRAGGNSQNFRMDHVHLSFLGGAGSIAAALGGWMYGVIDHCLFDMITGSVNNAVRVGHGTWNNETGALGNNSWADSTYFGSNKFIFFENNTVNGGYIDDCNLGGRVVFRDNSLNAGTIQNHQMENDFRGCRAVEVYNNTLVGDTHYSTDSQAIVMRTGTALVWGNTSIRKPTFLALNQDRTNVGAGEPHTQGANPNGWGYCGTVTATGRGQSASKWDQNPTASYGYACIDQIGRGIGQLLTGLFPNKVNSATGTISWPRNALEPIYEWLDKWTAVYSSPPPGAYASSNDGNTIAQNRDYYQYTLTWNGSAFTGTAFNGTVGTGSGLLSARPSTCTAGPGGNTPGVAYWAIDRNTLYVCNPTNTWTAYYTPYTYPHPLVHTASG